MFIEQMLHNSTSDRSRVTLSDAPIVEIPLKIHVIRETNGSGGLTEAQVNSAVNTVNSYFQNSNIMFYIFEGINFIDDSDFYNLSASQEGAIAVPNDVPNTINVYFSGSLSSSGTALCGYTRFPPSSDRVFVANGCVFGGTFEHELGHYFTLYHTHGKTNTGTTDELVDGSNCTTAGDNLCDTPADPNLSGKVSGSCAYTGGEKDANGDFFVPMVNNIMAYSLDQCQNALTAGQYERMRNGFENGRSYLNFKSTSFTALFTASAQEVCVGSSISFEANSFGATSYEWEFPGGDPATSEDDNPVVVYDTPGSFRVKLTTMNNTGGVAVIEKSNFVLVNDPLENAVSETIKTNFQEADVPSGWEIENPDSGFSFEISDIDKSGSSESNSIFVDNYNYTTDVPGNVDLLIPPTIDPLGVRGLTITFDYAYSYLDGFFDGTNVFPPRYDSLEILLDSKCLTEDVSLWKQGGEEMATIDEPAEDLFVPTNNDWESVTINYEFSGEFDFGLIKFKSISYNGNSLYLDDIVIEPDYGVHAPTSLKFENSNPSELLISWRDNSINELGFIVQRSLDGTEYVNIDTVGTNIKEYTDDISNESSEVYYRVIAQGVADNVSTESNVISINPVLTNVSNEFKNSLTVWPNPASDNVNLEIDVIGKYTYDVFDLSGRRLLKGSFKGTNHSIDISDLQSGVFVIKLNAPNGVITKRLFKN